MQVYYCDQGSDAWHASRAGCVTASKFSTARQLSMKSGSNKGGPGNECLAYALQVAIERISGTPLQDDQFETYSMRRGHELEPYARACHERLGIVVHRAGFCKTDNGWYGASTDGLIGDKGSSEYKCLVSPKGLREILIDDDLSAFTDQLQGGLMVTEREWMHYGLYCPALRAIGQEFTLRVVYRDDEYISALYRDLQTFRQIVEDNIGRLESNAARNEQHIAEALRCLTPA